MKSLLSVAAIGLLLAACANPLPQTPPPGVANEISAPTIRPGEVWRYAVRDGFTNLPRGTLEYRVTDVHADSVAVEARTDQGLSAETYTRDWNWLVRPATNMQTFVYQPAYQAYRFPLFAGETWSSRGSATDPATGRSFPVRISAQVLGWEKVRVPAGEFDTLKVRRGVYLDYFEQGVRGQSLIVETDWYAPAVGQAARRETTSQYWRLADAQRKPRFVRTGGDHDGDGDVWPRFEQDDWLVYELTGYSLR